MNRTSLFPTRTLVFPRNWRWSSLALLAITCAFSSGCKDNKPTPSPTATSTAKSTASGASPTSSSKTASPDTTGQAITDSWHFEQGTEKEDLVFSAKEMQGSSKTASMPGTFKFKKPIAKVIPDAKAKQGKIIVGPYRSDSDEPEGYEVIFWYELSDSSVKLHISGDQYKSVAEAESKAKGSEKDAKLYKKTK
jgi:hypothetical protein